MTTELADLVALAAAKAGHGALWGVETTDLDCTLVAWPQGSGVARHANAEVDVLMVVISGRVRLDVDDQSFELGPSEIAVIPVGAERRTEALSERAVYLNVHKRKKKIGLGNLGGFKGRSKPD
jgi:quercetin dioxygenase-like cupin family protein